MVTTKWLTESMKSGKFLKPGPFLLHDPVIEDRYKFELKASLRKSKILFRSSKLHFYSMKSFFATEKACEAPIFKGYTFYVTPSVKPTPPELSG